MRKDVENTENSVENSPVIEEKKQNNEPNINYLGIRRRNPMFLSVNSK